ncbi:MAG: acyl-CoA dehydrogenase family protein, partial [Acidimicrobiales bacterium]
MDLSLSPEQEAFAKVVADFAASEVAPHAAGWDASHLFPLDCVRAMGELGLFGLVFPERYGGSGADFTTFCLAVEELARVDSSVAITLSAGVGLGSSPIFRFGTDEQRERWLPDLCAGRALGAFGLTEPGGGSDAGATRTVARAERPGGDWVIDGSKAFITNSGTPITSVITVTARTPGAAPGATGGPAAPGAAGGGAAPGAAGAGARAGISCLLVPAGTPGLVVEEAYRKVGWHASDTHGLSLQGVRVPADHLLGVPGRGYAQFLATLDDGRISVAALAVGLAQGCLDESVAYAKARNAFGGPIGRYQAVAFKCADMAVAVDAARALTYRAAWCKDTGRPYKQQAAAAKLFATEAAVTAAREATQIFGGYGYM